MFGLVLHAPSSNMFITIYILPVCACIMRCIVTHYKHFELYNCYHWLDVVDFGRRKGKDARNLVFQYAIICVVC